MIDKRIGKRIKQRREQIGLTQEQFAEKLGVAPNYISTIERGASFPRCEKLIAIINGLETSADAIFCDVIDHAAEYRASVLSQKLQALDRITGRLWEIHSRPFFRHISIELDNNL